MRSEGRATLVLLWEVQVPEKQSSQANVHVGLYARLKFGLCGYSNEESGDLRSSIRTVTQQPVPYSIVPGGGVR